MLEGPARSQSANAELQRRVPFQAPVYGGPLWVGGDGSIPALREGLAHPLASVRKPALTKPRHLEKAVQGDVLRISPVRAT